MYSDCGSGYVNRNIDSSLPPFGRLEAVSSSAVKYANGSLSAYSFLGVLVPTNDAPR